MCNPSATDPFDVLATLGASATIVSSPTSSQPRRKSPATVTRFSSGRALRSESLACASRAATRCRWRRPSPVFAMTRFCRILVCSAAPSFGLLDAVFLRGGLQPGERGDAEILVESQNLLGAETRHGEHLEHTLRNLLPELLEGRMSAALVKLGDHVGDPLADAGDFGKPVFGDEPCRGTA